MSLEGLSAQEIDELQQQLLAQVPADGVIGNTRLREALRWENDRYWAVRNRLVENGILETGRGKGGSVRRVPTPPDIAPAEHVQAEAAPAQQEAEPFQREEQLYEPIAAVLKDQWAKEQGFDAYSVEVTARQGSRQTGGKWTRPDMTVVGYKTFPYVPGRFLEVVTFEVKPFSTIDVSSVYEALAHRRASTRAYVVLHVPEAREAQLELAVEATCEEAKRHGIGVIVATNPGNFDDWDVRFEAERFEPDPSRLNEFIAQQLSEGLKEQLIKWFK
ncbi:hypothetical protein [Burkholderia cepacia]|uniref:hypothetical protein n=1 Tax=Burkholderia cepacia TaxID=292 RepID=UPI0012D8912E|nr:hypothetical protein [Burkholderia cepacia]